MSDHCPSDEARFYTKSKKEKRKMLKKNLIFFAIISLTLISAGAAFGQPARQRARPQAQPIKPRTDAARSQPSRTAVRPGTTAGVVPQGLNSANKLGNFEIQDFKAKRQPGSDNLTKTGAGTLNAAENRPPQPSRNRVPRGRTNSRIIMANTEGDFHLKGKTRQPRQ